MKNEAKLLIGIGAATLVLLFGGIFILSKNTPSDSSGQGNPKALEKVLIKPDSYQTASQSAKVSIVEFADFQCPACGATYPVISQVLKTYGDKVNLVFRNFPLSQHQNAIPAAVAARSAGSQGKFWQMYDLLYQNQAEWSDLTDPTDTFVKYATQIGLDINQFKNDLGSNKDIANINQDRADGQALGVNSTPTFYINGEKLPLNTAPTLDTFKSKIDPFLK